ncbi:unnamed protein product [Rodentolepis nana]|uniref:Secreted protein n=1 Tax=Rodentolepis nana TaxID=102285 RepID=A0A0R3T1J7_RODNA|nr:unnamed protein product [Rodentolepis nana]
MAKLIQCVIILVVLISIVKACGNNMNKTSTEGHTTDSPLPMPTTVSSEGEKKPPEETTDETGKKDEKENEHGNTQDEKN